MNVDEMAGYPAFVSENGTTRDTGKFTLFLWNGVRLAGDFTIDSDKISELEVIHTTGVNLARWAEEKLNKLGSTGGTNEGV